MLLYPLSECQARARLQELLDWNKSHLPNYSGADFIEPELAKMYREFGGKWDGHRAMEYLNSLGADMGHRLSDEITN
jgi:hypothetical protein